MIANTEVDGTALRAGGTLILYNEIVSVVYDARWMIALLVLLIVTDFRYGWGENSKRYAQAKEEGKESLAIHFRWRTSRAIRRTMNKFMDYFFLMMVFAALGMALLEPIGVNHVYGVYAAACIAFFCEFKSIAGHFFYLRGVSVADKTISSFIKAFIVALAKRKNHDVGEALDEAFDGNRQEHETPEKP